MVGEITKITRRDLLKKGALVAVGVALTGGLRSPEAFAQGPDASFLDWKEIYGIGLNMQVVSPEWAGGEADSLRVNGIIENDLERGRPLGYELLVPDEFLSDDANAVIVTIRVGDGGLETKHLKLKRSLDMTKLDGQDPFGKIFLFGGKGYARLFNAGLDVAQRDNVHPIFEGNGDFVGKKIVVSVEAGKSIAIKGDDGKGGERTRHEFTPLRSVTGTFTGGVGHNPGAQNNSTR